MNLVVMRARMEGFIVIDYMDRFAEGAAALLGWMQAGELIHRDDVQEGFENIPNTLKSSVYRQEHRQADAEDRGSELNACGGSDRRSVSRGTLPDRGCSGIREEQALEPEKAKRTHHPVADGGGDEYPLIAVQLIEAIGQRDIEDEHAGKGECGGRQRFPQRVERGRCHHQHPPEPIGPGHDCKIPGSGAQDRR